MTVTVGLITTGQCEHRALAGSLARMFGECDVEFRSLLGGPAGSLTSAFVTYPAPRAKVPTLADRLVQRMHAELERRDGPDLVIAVDDLELDNIETPGYVSGVVRDAIVRAMGDVPTHAQRARFRDRCSFHLLCPMVEAYFCGEFLASGDRYRETIGGRAALATLDWHQVFARQPPGLAFAHALFDDIADALGVASPFPGDAHLATARRANGVLRNL
jgi:hypothetical protein